MGRQIPFSENKMTMFRTLTQEVYEIKTSFVHVIYHIPATALTDKDNPGSVSFVPDPEQEKKLFLNLTTDWRIQYHRHAVKKIDMLSSEFH